MGWIQWNIRLNEWGNEYILLNAKMASFSAILWKSLIKVGTLTDTGTVKPALNDTMN
jgi:hypothetical protein